MAADVIGYSWLIGEDEDGTHAALTGLRREVSDPRIAEHRDRIVKTTGDRLMVEFASVVDAHDIFSKGLSSPICTPADHAGFRR